MTVRKPRPKFLVAGTAVPGIEKITIHRNNHLKADTFEATFPINVDPLRNYNWWLTQLEIKVEFQSETGVSILKGYIDGVRVNFTDMCIEVHGRDESKVFMDAKTLLAYSNRTSSEIVTMFANQFGFIPDVDKTSTVVGKYYDADHITIHLGQFSTAKTLWDFMVMLATRENFDLWCSNGTLHFKKAVDPTTAAPRVLVYQPATSKGGASRANASTITGLSVEHNLALAKDISVTYYSWDAGYFAARHYTAGKKTKDGTEYIRYLPGVKLEVLKQHAEAELDQITKHEYKIDVQCPGDLTLDPRTPLVIQGLNGVASQTYIIEAVELEYDFEDGFSMSIGAKNHPDGTVGA
jgi:hypothetical protein